MMKFNENKLKFKSFFPACGESNILAMEIQQIWCSRGKRNFSDISELNLIFNLKEIHLPDDAWACYLCLQRNLYVWRLIRFEEK